MPIFPTLPERTRGLSAANTALTLSTQPVTKDIRKVLRAVYLHYSGNVTLNATVTLNSGVTSDFDVVLGTMVFIGQQDGFFIPDNPMPMSLGDVIDVLAPAGGASIAAGIQILTDNEYPVKDGEGGYQVDSGRRV